MHPLPGGLRVLKTARPAEEVGQVFPSVVEWEADGDDAQGLDYTRLVPILLEGIKDQQRQLESQQAQLNYLMSIVGVDCE